LRQAHRVALRAGGIRAAPGWIVGGLIGAAFLSTTMVAGSTDRAPAVTGRSIDASLAALTSGAVSAPLAGSVSPVGAASVDTSGGVPPGASPARDLMAARSWPAVASAAPHPKATPHPTTAAIPEAVASVTPLPRTTPHPAAARPVTTPSVKVVSRSTAAPRKMTAPVKKPIAPATAAPHTTATPAMTSVPRATAAPKLKAPAPKPRAPAPKPKATAPKPPPAIVYPHQAAGRATWGEFGGAVVTRLPQGTRIRVCGRLGCWEGVSTGYGPTASGGNLVDLDAAVFRRICGPLGVGVGAVVLSWR
jgi:hypothetical protein